MARRLAFEFIKTSMTIIHHYLRKELLILSSFIFALSFLTSCEKQPDLGEFGSQNVTDNSTANIVIVDSSTVLLSTVYVDSVASAATTYLQVGTYNDPLLGQVNSQAFLQVRPPVNLPTLDPQLDTYDSIGMTLFFRKSNPYYGDTTLSQTFEVHQVVDTLYQLNQPNQTGWYSDNYLPIGPALGSTTVSIAPNLPYTSQNSGDTVKIRMADSLGQEIYNMVYNKSDTLTILQDWFNWFKGLCITPGAGEPGGTMYGFFDSCLMRVYYRQNINGFSTTRSIDFTLYNRPSQWNYITNNRTGSAIANLVTPTNVTQPPPTTPSYMTGNASYVDNMLGLTTKITFPYLNSISQRPDYIGLLRATLTIVPLAGTFNTTLTLPPSVGIYSTDLHNVPEAPIYAVGSSALQTGSVVPNYFQPLLTQYTYDVTNFVAAQIANTSPGANQVGLMLSISSPATLTQWRRLAIADQSFPTQQRIVLSVYYISLYPHQ
jgi:hypothetical protein